MKIQDLENKIINKDCMDVLKKIPDKSIDLLFIDPPYRQEYHSRSQFNINKKIQGEKIKEYGSNLKLDYTSLFNTVIPKLKKINMFIFCDTNTKYDFIDLAKKSKFFFKEIAFCKTNPTPFLNNQWLSDIEWGLHIFYRIPVYGNYKTKRSFFVMNNFKEPKIDHPTPKKVSIYKSILKNISKEGDLVLDCFSGSGTTAISCIDLNRNFICIEKDKKYYKDSLVRIKNKQNQIELFNEENYE